MLRARNIVSLSAVLRIRDFIPDSTFCHPGSTAKNFNNLTQNIVFLALGNNVAAPNPDICFGPPGSGFFYHHQGFGSALI